MSIYSFEDWELNEAKKKKKKDSYSTKLMNTIKKLMVVKQPAVSTEVIVDKFKYLDFKKAENDQLNQKELERMKDVNSFLKTFRYVWGLNILVNPTIAKKDLNFNNQIPSAAYDYNNLPNLWKLPVDLTKYIVRFFMAAGLSKSGAIALAANYWKESRFNPAQDQIGGGPGYGLAQWDLKDRWNKFVNNFLSPFVSSNPEFSRSHKHDLDAQLAYTIYELKVRYNPVYLELMKPGRIEDKVILIMQKYEICKLRNDPGEQQERSSIAGIISNIVRGDHWIDIIQSSIKTLKDIDLKRFL